MRIIKIVITVIILLLCASCNQNIQSNISRDMEIEATENITSKSVDLREINVTYNISNNLILNNEPYEKLTNINYNDVYQFSEYTRGEFSPRGLENNVFPSELVLILQEQLYNINNYELREKLGEDVLENSYFETLKEFGSEKYEINYEELTKLIPNFESKYPEIYSNLVVKDYSSQTALMGVFYIPDNNEYLFLNKTGGTNGSVTANLIRLINGNHSYVSQFTLQNYGEAKVIEHDNEWYLVYLHYNYNLKVYDGIMVHKLGVNAESDNVLIKYIPIEYVWKNFYCINDDINSKIDQYINSIKDEIVTDEYIENGLAKDIVTYNGDEVSVDENFIIDVDENNYYFFESQGYYSVDFTNTETEIYFRKSNHIPSNYNTVWYLKSEFYIYDKKAESFVELENMSISNTNLVQLWFKKIDGKIYTFSLYKMRDYNYCLNVGLIENDKTTQIRTDILSPKKQFKVFQSNLPPFLG